MTPPRMPTLQELVGTLRDRCANPQRRELVVRVTMDFASLQARQLAGEANSAELAQVASQAASLTAVEAAMIRDAVVAWISEATKVAVGAVFAAAVA